MRDAPKSGYPSLTAVVPEGGGGPILLAYYMGPDAASLQRYLDHWIEVQEKNGFAEGQSRYWIEGIPSEEREPRWSILRNVLHWVR